MPNDRDRWTAATLVAAMTCLFVGGLGCGNQADQTDPRDQTYQFALEVEATDTEGNPVVEAPVKLDGNIVGYTDKQGGFQGNIAEKPGTEIELALGELDGYRYTDGASTSEALELKPSLSGKGKKGVPVLLKVEAQSLKRHYLVWVQTDCSDDDLSDDACRGLPVAYNRETVAKTDQFGTAHFSIRERPGKAISVAVRSPRGDSDDAPEITPHDPTYEIETALEPTVYLLEPSFEIEDDDTGTRRRRRQRTRRQPSTTSGSNDSASSGEASGGSGSNANTETANNENTETANNESGTDDGAGSGSSGSSANEPEKKEEQDGPIDLFGQ